MIECLEGRMMLSASTFTTRLDDSVPAQGTRLMSDITVSNTAGSSTARQTFGDTLSTKPVQGSGSVANGAATLTSSAMGMQAGSGTISQVSGVGNQMQSTGGSSTQAAMTAT